MCARAQPCALRRRAVRCNFTIADHGAADPRHRRPVPVASQGGDPQDPNADDHEGAPPRRHRSHSAPSALMSPCCFGVDVTLPLRHRCRCVGVVRAIHIDAAVAVPSRMNCMFRCPTLRAPCIPLQAGATLKPFLPQLQTTFLKALSDTTPNGARGRYCESLSASACLASLGLAGLCSAWLGLAWLGLAWLGLA